MCSDTSEREHNTENDTVDPEALKKQFTSLSLCNFGGDVESSWIIQSSLVDVIGTNAKCTIPKSTFNQGSRKSDWPKPTEKEHSEVKLSYESNEHQCSAHLPSHTLFLVATCRTL